MPQRHEVWSKARLGEQQYCHGGPDPYAAQRLGFASIAPRRIEMSVSGHSQPWRSLMEILGSPLDPKSGHSSSSLRDKSFAPPYADTRKFVPSYSTRLAKRAPQMRTALSKIESNTGARSPGDELITSSTLEAAVCCSSDSVRSSVRWRSSLSSRAFSMAMTACAAKFLTNSICLSVNGLTREKGRLLAEPRRGLSRALESKIESAHCRGLSRHQH